MTRPHKFFFDECVINLPTLEKLRAHFAASESPPVLGHVVESQLRGQWDEVWIPKIAEEGWVVVSTDRGRGGRKRGEKLRRVCVACQVTHILVSARIGEKKQQEKLELFKAAWEKLELTTEAERGTRFSLKFDNAGELVIARMTVRE